MSTSWKLGGCTRCGGAMYLDQDEGDQFWHCINCGRFLYVSLGNMPQEIRPTEDVPYTG